MIFQPFGAGKADLSYLLRNPTAKILAGDPALFRQLTNTMTSNQNVFSGVLSFSEDLEYDATQPRKRGRIKYPHLVAIIDSFRVVMSVRRDRNRIYWLLVLHFDKGRTEVHCLGIEVDLITGKKVTIYLHRRDSERLIAWQRLINRRLKLTDPESLNSQLSALPNPRSRDYNVKLDLFRRVQARFKDADQATQNDVARFLKQQGFEVLAHYPNKKRRPFLAVVVAEKVLVLRGIYFGKNFDLAKTRRRKPAPTWKLKNRFERLMRRFRTWTDHRYHSQPVSELPALSLSKRFFELSREVLGPSKPFLFIDSKQNFTVEVPKNAYDKLKDVSAVAARLRHFFPENICEQLLNAPELHRPPITIDTNLKTPNTEAGSPASLAPTRQQSDPIGSRAPLPTEQGTPAKARANQDSAIKKKVKVTKSPKGPKRDVASPNVKNFGE